MGSNAIDTTGMLCICGKKLIRAGIDNGCQVLACPDMKRCGTEYRIPLDDPRTLPFPWEAVRVSARIYKCIDCKMEIDEEQAKRTFQEEGRALCVICEGREYGIEIQGFGI